MSTLNFAITNKEQKDKSYTVYLRYFFKDEQGKKKLKHFPTSFSLNKADFEKLKINKLGGNVSKELQKEKQFLQNIIDDIQQEKQGIDATDIEVHNRLNANKIVLHSINSYFNLMLNNHSIKAKSTIRQYTSIIKKFEKWIYKERDYINVKSLNQNIFDRYVNYLHQTDLSNLKTISSINNNAIKTKQLINFILEQINSDQRVNYKSITVQKDDIYLFEDEINKLVNHSTSNRTLQEMQLYIAVNRFIGLRRNELINLKNENIEHHKEHTTLKFWESKKHQFRTITIIDKNLIQLLKKHQTNNEYFFNLKVLNIWNINLVIKQLAKECKLNRKVQQYKIKDKQRIILEKSISDVIHTHQIRAYAIQYNLMKYGSLIAKAYSGHTSVTMIEKHYSHQLNEQEQLQMLREKS